VVPARASNGEPVEEGAMSTAARITNRTIDQITYRVDVADLFTHLANLLDECRHDDAPTVYHDDIVVRSPRGELHGLDEVTAHLKRSQVEGEHTQHVHGDVLVQLDGVDGDRAKATPNQLVYFYRAGEAPHRTSGLRVACTAVRTPAG
jgi:3-phenylpropionate/cinnamic acid dioxygenase small subunit